MARKAYLNSLVDCGKMTCVRISSEVYDELGNDREWFSEYNITIIRISLEKFPRNFRRHVIKYYGQEHIWYYFNDRQIALHFKLTFGG
jgi:hypothetical protein